jgi:paraquat-inducible protein B
MAKQANKTVIGAFVVGALALIVAGVLIFGSGRFLAAQDTYVMYFTGSVKGLNVGAPVVLRGVKIGSVKDIMLRYDPKDVSVLIPVIIEIEPERVAKLQDTKVSSRRERRENLQQLIERGLRAQLETQSFVTGQLMIQVDIHPDEPLRLVGGDSPYPEIPTIPSSMEEIQKTLDKVIETFRKLPLEELVAKLLHTVEGIDNLVNSPDMTASIKSLHQALEEIRKFVANLDREFIPLASSVEETLDAGRKLVKNVDSKIDPVVNGIDETTEAARKALEAAEQVLVSVEDMLDKDSPLRYQFNDALEQITSAARSFRVLCDQLEQHPESLLRGRKGEPGGKRK